MAPSPKTESRVTLPVAYWNMVAEFYFKHKDNPCLHSGSPTQEQPSLTEQKVDEPEEPVETYDPMRIVLNPKGAAAAKLRKTTDDAGSN